MFDEIGRVGGEVLAQIGINSIALPPIIVAGSDYIKVGTRHRPLSCVLTLLPGSRPARCHHRKGELIAISLLIFLSEKRLSGHLRTMGRSRCGQSPDDCTSRGRPLHRERHQKALLFAALSFLICTPQVDHGRPQGRFLHHGSADRRARHGWHQPPTAGARHAGD